MSNSRGAPPSLHVAAPARLLAALDDAVLATDARYRVTLWNAAAERIYGWSADEAVGQDVRELVRPELSAEQLADAQGTLAEQGRFRAELVTHRRDGMPIEVEATAIAIPNANGEPPGYLAIHRDATSRKRHELDLQRMMTVVDNSRDFVGLNELDGRMRYVNNAGRQLVGLHGLGRVRRTALLDYFTNDDRPFAREVVLPRALERGRWVGDRLLHLRHFKTGRAIAASVQAYRIDDPRSGAPVDIGVIARDMSEQQRLEVRFRTIFERIRDDFVAVDRSWRFTYLNDRALGRIRAETGRSLERKDVLGTVAWELVPYLVGSPLHRHLEEAMDEQRTVRFEAELPRSTSWLEVCAYPFSGGLAIHSRDIAERKRAQRDLALSGRQQAAVAALGSSALRDGGMRSLLQEVVETVATALDVEYVKICELLPGERELMLRAGVGWPADAVGSEREPTRRGSHGGYALVRDEPVVVQELAGERRFEAGPTLREGGATSALAVVIAGASRPYGVLEVQSRARRSFSPSDVDFVQSVANVVTAAVAAERLAAVSERGVGPLKAQPAAAVRLLLVGDHLAIRESLAIAFAREPGFDVVGQAASLAYARRRFAHAEVDVAVLSVDRPDGETTALITALRECNPRAQAVVLATDLNRLQLARALDSGAAGALSKTAPLDEVVRAVRRLRDGASLLPPAEIVELLRFAAQERERERDDRLAIADLTPRELEVLQALAEGLDSRQIAERLQISLRTGRNHVASILTKLGVHSQLQAVVVALRYGLVEIR
jgi:PAS domain S-box-containing protein